MAKIKVKCKMCGMIYDIEETIKERCPRCDDDKYSYLGEVNHDNKEDIQ